MWSKKSQREAADNGTEERRSSRVKSTKTFVGSIQICGTYRKTAVKRRSGWMSGSFLTYKRNLMSSPLYIKSLGGESLLPQTPIWNFLSAQRLKMRLKNCGLSLVTTGCRTRGRQHLNGDQEHLQIHEERSLEFVYFQIVCSPELIKPTNICFKVPIFHSFIFQMFQLLPYS